MLDKIIQMVSAKKEIPEDIVEKAIRSQFEFVKDTMEQGEFQSVRLQYLGVFGVKPNRLILINEWKNPIN